MDIRARHVHVHHIENDAETTAKIERLKESIWRSVIREHVTDPSYEDPRIPTMEAVLACIDLVVDAMASIAISNRVSQEQAREDGNQLGRDLVERVNQFTHKMAEPFIGAN